MKEHIIKSLKEYANNGERSSAKLIPIHQKIKNDVSKYLISNYKVKNLGSFSLDSEKSLSKEKKFQGRYYDKKIDISFFLDRKEIGGIGVKIPIANINQNFNNYFENMLGETANIRSNNIPYFQVIIFPIKTLYFKKNGTVSKIEQVNLNKFDKYLKLSKDNVNTFFHAPNKILFIFYEFKSFNVEKIHSKNDFLNKLKSEDLDILISKINLPFNGLIIENDYDLFIKKISSIIFGNS